MKSDFIPLVLIPANRVDGLEVLSTNSLEFTLEEINFSEWDSSISFSYLGDKIITALEDRDLDFDLINLLSLCILNNKVVIEVDLLRLEDNV